MAECLLHLGTIFVIRKPKIPSCRSENNVLEDGREKPKSIHQLVHQRWVPPLNTFGDIFWPFLREPDQEYRHVVHRKAVVVRPVHELRQVVWEESEESRVVIIEGRVFHDELADNGERHIEKRAPLRHYKLRRRARIKRPEA